METVTARYQIESSRTAVLEFNIDAGRIFTNVSDAVTKDGFDLVCDSMEDCFREIAAQQAKETLTKRASKNFSVESAPRAAALIHKFHAVDEITDIAQVWNEVHPLGDVKSDAPEIDHVTALAEMRSTLDQHRFKSSMPQPINQRRTSNAGPGYKNRFLSHEKSLQRMREKAIEHKPSRLTSHSVKMGDRDAVVCIVLDGQYH